MGTSDARKVIVFGIFLAGAGFGIVQIGGWINAGYAVGQPAVEELLGSAPATPLLDLWPGWVFFGVGVVIIGGGIAMSIFKSRSGM